MAQVSLLGGGEALDRYQDCRPGLLGHAGGLDRAQLELLLAAFDRAGLGAVRDARSDHGERVEVGACQEVVFGQNVKVPDLELQEELRAIEVVLSFDAELHAPVEAALGDRAVRSLRSERALLF